MNNHSENIQKVYTMVGEKPPTSKVKIGIITSLTVIIGLTGILLADDLALAFHSIQQKNLKEAMVELDLEEDKLTLEYKEAKAKLTTEYFELKAKLDKVDIGEAGAVK